MRAHLRALTKNWLSKLRLLLLQECLGDWRVELELLMHLPDYIQQIRMALPISEFLTYVKILTILADLIVNDAMHYVNTWRHLREGEWDRQAHI